jgi:ribonuclease J
MHFDHAMHLKFVDGKIPVFLGAAADCIRCCWEATGGNSVDFGDHDFRTFRTGDRLKIGSLEFEPIHVDHSVPGAYGYVVHTSEGCVAYTGDMRLHGPRSDMTKEFVARAAKEKPLALLCEGTRVSDSDPREDLSEKDVEQRAQRLVSSHGQLSVVSFYPKDVDRMRSFRNVAKETGRKFVVSTKVAHLLQALARDSHIDVPDPMTDPSMMVYVRSGMTRPLPYEKPFLDKLGSGHVIDSDYVARHQRQLIFHTDFMQLTELIDVQPEQGSLFIRSKSEPFEEGDVQEEVLKNWIDWFKLDFHQVHASGHASMSEVFSAVKQIAPRLLIPVHTEHPELFSRCGRSLKCPVAGERISLPQ